MKNFKIIMISVLVGLVIIVILQNVQSVETRFLFIKVTMPIAVLLLLTFLFGFGAGLLASFTFEDKTNKQKSIKEKTQHGKI
ncbi:MAG: DUF1049 domain-containing protein [Sedimentisphaerales bacterium]|nr:DUF1049 domain-containing protein [Sedimentisphaerales bacterium]